MSLWPLSVITMQVEGPRQVTSPPSILKIVIFRTWRSYVSGELTVIAHSSYHIINFNKMKHAIFYS